MVSRTGIALLVFIGLAGLFPSAVNWGGHFWAFLPIPLIIACALVMIAALVPRTQDMFIGFLRSSTAVFSGRNRFPHKGLWGIVCCGAGLIFWFFRQKTFFLGDGYLVLRTLPVAAASGDIPASFPTAPLTGLIASGLFRFYLFLGASEPGQLAWQSLSLASGIVAVPVVWHLAGAIVTDVLERAGVALLLLCSGAAMLFFGYVETYPPAFTAMLGFIGSCLNVRSGKGSLTTASVLFVILVFLHVGMVILLPAFVFVVFGAVRSGGWKTLVRPLLIAGAVKIVILVLLSYSPRQLVATFVRDGSSFLPLLRPDGWNASYSLFSVWHWVDLFNLHLLVFPFAVVLTGGLFAGAVVPARYRQPGVFFWVALAAPPLVWLILNNFELGMSRDWDLASPFAFVVGLGGLAGWLTMMGPSEQRVRGIVLMAMMTVAHTAAWVGVNASGGSSLMRFDALLDFRFISPRAMAIAYEEVGGYRRSRGDLLGAADAYARCVVLDSTNARRWTLFANIEGLQGNIAVARDAYERAIALGSLDPEVYLNLGIILYDQGDLDAGLREVGEAAAMDSLDPVVSFTLGRMLFEGRGDMQRALPWFERTIRLDPADSIARSFADRCRARIEATAPTHVPGAVP